MHKYISICICKIWYEFGQLKRSYYNFSEWDVIFCHPCTSDDLLNEIRKFVKSSNICIDQRKQRKKYIAILLNQCRFYKNGYYIQRKNVLFVICYLLLFTRLLLLLTRHLLLLLTTCYLLLVTRYFFTCYYLLITCYYLFIFIVEVDVHQLYNFRSSYQSILISVWRSNSISKLIFWIRLYHMF